MTAKTTKTEDIADPLAERKKVMQQHLGTQPHRSVTKSAGKPANQQASKEPMIKVTFRLPDGHHKRLERIHGAIKLAKLDEPREKRRVLVQDLFIEAVSDYLNKMEKKYNIQ